MVPSAQHRSTELKAMAFHCEVLLVWWMRTGQERLNSYGHRFFAARKSEVANRGHQILHWLADYSHMLWVEASAKKNLHSPTFFNKLLEDLQQVVQRAFQKDCEASIAAKNRIWNPNMNKGDFCMNWKDCQQERARHTNGSTLIILYMEKKDNSWTGRRHAALRLR